MKILFLGNSHTFFNDMPELFARFMEKTAGQKPEVVMLAYPGRDLDWHLREYYALRFNLMYGGYDYCVIQQAAHPYPPVEATLETGACIIDLCRRCGVEPVVYMTWAEKRFPENQQKMIDTCEKLARDHGTLLAPIGCVWQKVQQERPDIELYHTDGEHAGPYGDFLIAAVLCSLFADGISDEVIGTGMNFIDPAAEDKKPPVLEERDPIRVKLDREKTGYILQAVREWGQKTLS